MTLALVRTGLLTAFLLSPGAGAPHAQSLVPQPPTPPTRAGWTVTPSVAVASLWDDNVALFSEEQGPIEDLVTAVSPSVGSHYRGRRGKLLLDYRGTYEFYRQYNQFDAADHRGRLDADHRLSRTVTLFARDSFTHTPTTETPLVDSALLTLRRRTTRFNDFRGGLQYTPAPRTLFEIAYGSQWVELVGDEFVSPLLRGGYAHRGDVQLRRQLSDRFVLGGLYDYQYAIVSDGETSFDIQNAAAVMELALGPALVVSGSVGYAWQVTAGDARSAPTVRATVRYQRNRAFWEFGYSRAFLPSFGFGGTVRNEELGGSVSAPVSRRVELTGRLSARESDALDATYASLRGLSAQATVLWTLASRLRLEFFTVYLLQDSQQPGGRIGRSRAGIRLVTFHPMRLR